MLKQFCYATNYAIASSSQLKLISLWSNTVFWPVCQVEGKQSEHVVPTTSENWYLGEVTVAEFFSSSCVQVRLSIVVTATLTAQLYANINIRVDFILQRIKSFTCWIEQKVCVHAHRCVLKVCGESSTTQRWWERACKPQIQSHTRVMCFMPCQQASLGY